MANVTGHGTPVQLVDGTDAAIGSAANPLNVAGVGGTFEATMKSTAAAPSYVEGSVNPLSSDLSGNLRATITLGSGSNTIGKVDVLGNAGATLDATLAAGAAPTNGIAIIGQMNTTPPTLTNTQTGSIQLSAKSNLLNQIMDAAGNNRGANVDANNALTVNHADINGSAVVTSATGVQRVGIAGNANATLDGTLAAGTAPTNGVGNLAQYLNNAGQLSLTTAQTGSLQTDPAGNLRTAPQRPVAADILGASHEVANGTITATTLITIPAGRTWVGTLAINVTASTAAASTANAFVQGIFSVAGTNATPAAGNYLLVSALTGANAATGTVGTQNANYSAIPFVAVAPAGNSITIQYAVPNATGTNTDVNFAAFGVLQ